jgi:hypothetical protein
MVALIDACPASLSQVARGGPNQERGYSVRRRKDQRTVQVQIGVPCHDGSGRASELVLALDRDRLLLGKTSGEIAVLTPLEAGRLRAAIRDLVLRGDEDRPLAKG